MNTSDLSKRLNTKFTNIENIPKTNLVTNATINVKVAESESKISGITDLVKKNNFNTKITEIENKKTKR